MKYIILGAAIAWAMYMADKYICSNYHYMSLTNTHCDTPSIKFGCLF